MSDHELQHHAKQAGYAGASVTSYIERMPYRNAGEPETTPTAWFVLAVKRAADKPFEVIARRRTVDELVEKLRG